MPPKVIQQDFTAGIKRSRARADLGAGTLWDAKDYIIGRLGVPLGKRGGWRYQGSRAESTVDATPDFANAMSNDPFNGGNFMRLQDKQGKFWWAAASEDYAIWHKERIYPDGVAGEYNQNGKSKQNGVFLGDGLLFPSEDGTKLGSSHNEIYGQDYQIAAGSGGEPIYVCTHLNRFWGLDTHENLWAGHPGQATPWDEDAKYNLGQPGKGIASLGQEMFVFFDGQVRKVRGTTPAGYGVVADDIEISLYSGDVGLIDAFSIVHWNTQVIWVDHNGVWASDGTNYPLDLAWAGGAQDLFREFISPYVNTEKTRVACGIYSNMLAVSMTDLENNEHIDTIVCDLNRRTWSRWGNTGFTCYVRGALDTSETWGGLGTSDQGRVGALSTILIPSGATAYDGNGLPVNPVFETAFYMLGPEEARVIAAWLGYAMDTEGLPEIQTITTESTTGTWDLWGHVLDFDASVADVQDALDAEDIDATASGVPGAWVITWNTDGEQDDLSISSIDLDAAITLTITQQGFDVPELIVEYAVEPRSDPTFESYNAVQYHLAAKDIHGANDDGYHWKPVPIRDQGPGVSIRVTQTGPSGQTSIHNIGLESISRPTFSQR